MPPKESKPAVYVHTLGCQMNELDSELVRDQLAARGYPMAFSAEAAGVILVNTCSVRQLAEHKVWSLLGRLGVSKRAERPELLIGVLGCMAEREAAEIRRRMPHVELVCGPARLAGLPDLLEEALTRRRVQVATSRYAQRCTGAGALCSQEDIEAFDGQRTFARGSASSQAYVRITRGCNKFCSYCVVPYARGPEVHRDPEQIVDEVQALVRRGVLEVTLLGQSVNHYAFQRNGRTTGFADLLWRVHQEVPELPRLRFVTSYPRDFAEETLDVMAEAPRICPFLHLPAQSGSNRILQLMNRGYSVESYLELMAKARAKLPTVRLAGDMIVGFPTESDEDHEASLALVRAARYKSCFVFKYSPRPATVAARRFDDNVASEIKRARNNELLAVQAAISQAHNEHLAGQRVEVLVEGNSALRNQPPDASAQPSGSSQLLGRTVGDEIVAFAGPQALVGKIVTVELLSASPLAIRGRL